MYVIFRDVTSDGLVNLYYVSTSENIADVFTKPISGRRIRELLSI